MRLSKVHTPPTGTKSSIMPRQRGHCPCSVPFMLSPHGQHTQTQLHGWITAFAGSQRQTRHSISFSPISGITSIPMSKFTTFCGCERDPIVEAGARFSSTYLYEMFHTAVLNSSLLRSWLETSRPAMALILGLTFP